MNFSTTKISLNNNSKTLFLYNQKGDLIDKAEFTGTVPEGKSLARQNKDIVFTNQPTPGFANVFKNSAANLGESSKSQLLAITADNISPTPINAQLQNNFNHLIIGIILALIFSALFAIIFKKLNSEQE